MYFTAFELRLILWLIIVSGILVPVIFGYIDSMKRDWAEIKRLRADKEALTEILLAFLKGKVETQTPKVNNANMEEHR